MGAEKYVQVVRTCGIHGDDTTGGRCASCDRERVAHERTGSGYAYCGQQHPGGDAEAREWCRVHHRPFG